MKIGDLVKVVYPNKDSNNIYAYGILTDDNVTNYHLSAPYIEVWVYKYPKTFGDMPAKKSIFPKNDVKVIKTVEDW